MMNSKNNIFILSLVFLISTSCIHSGKTPLVKYWEDMNYTPIYPPKTLEAGTTIRTKDQATIANFESCFNLNFDAIKTGSLAIPEQQTERQITLAPKLALELMSSDQKGSNNIINFKFEGRLKTTRSIQIRYTNPQTRFIPIKDLENNIKMECLSKIKDVNNVTISEVVLARVDYTFIDKNGTVINLEGGLTAKESNALIEAGVNLSDFNQSTYFLQSKILLAHAYKPAFPKEIGRQQLQVSSSPVLNEPPTNFIGIKGNIEGLKITGNKSYGDNIRMINVENGTLKDVDISSNTQVGKNNELIKMQNSSESPSKNIKIENNISIPYK